MVSAGLRKVAAGEATPYGDLSKYWPSKADEAASGFPPSAGRSQYIAMQRMRAAQANQPAVPGKQVAQVPVQTPQMPQPVAQQAVTKPAGLPQQKPFKPPQLGVPTAGTPQLNRIARR